MPNNNLHTPKDDTLDVGDDKWDNGCNHLNSFQCARCKLLKCTDCNNNYRLNLQPKLIMYHAEHWICNNCKKEG